MKERIEQKVLADAYVNQLDLDHDWFDTHLMQPWSKLRPGDRVLKNSFRFTPIQKNQRSYTNPFFEVDNNQLYFRDKNTLFRVDIISTPTDFQLINFIYGGQQRRIGLVQDLQNGRATIIRNLFIHPDESQQEYTALVQLDHYGYPVPSHPQMHQLFFPWTDTISYDYVPRKSLQESVEENLQSGNMSTAYRIMFEFGHHLNYIWRPLLEGRLPNGMGFGFPDSVLGNWIYSLQASDAKRRFVRIDVLRLTFKNPLGFETYIKKIGEEIMNDNLLQNHHALLYTALRNGASAV